MCECLEAERRVGKKFTEVFTFFLSPPLTSLVALGSLVKQTDLSRLITHFNCPSAAQLPAHLKRLHCFLLHKYLDTNQAFIFYSCNFTWRFSPHLVSMATREHFWLWGGRRLIITSLHHVGSWLEGNIWEAKLSIVLQSCHLAIQGSEESQEAFWTFHWFNDSKHYIFIYIINKNVKWRAKNILGSKQQYFTFVWTSIIDVSPGWIVQK